MGDITGPFRGLSGEYTHKNSGSHARRRRRCHPTISILFMGTKRKLIAALLRILYGMGTSVNRKDVFHLINTIPRGSEYRSMA